MKITLNNENKANVNHLEAITDNLTSGLCNYLIDTGTTKLSELFEPIPKEIRKHFFKNLEVRDVANDPDGSR